MAALNRLREMLMSPEAMEKLSRLLDEAPQVMDLFQNRALARALNSAGRGDSQLGLIEPDTFRLLASPIGKDELHTTTPDRIQAIKNILSKDPELDVTVNPIASDGLSYFTEGQIRRLNDPGLESVPFLRIDSPMNDIAHVVGHEGRHRNRALNDMGVLDSLVEFKPRIAEEREAVSEALSNPDSEVFQQWTNRYRGRVGDLFRMLSIGGLSALPMLEESHAGTE